MKTIPLIVGAALLSFGAMNVTTSGSVRDTLVGSTSQSADAEGLSARPPQYADAEGLSARPPQYADAEGMSARPTSLG